MFLADGAWWICYASTRGNMTHEIAQLNEAIDEIKGLLVEAEFNARWQLIEAYHQAGKIIVSLPGDRTGVVKRIATGIGRSERMLWYAVKFAEKYKRVDDLPEGKNASWNMVIQKHLTNPAEEKPCEHVSITLCAKCRKVLDK